MLKREVSHIQETTKCLIESRVSESILSKDMPKDLCKDIYITRLFNNAVSISDHTAVNDSLIWSNKLEKVGRKDH
jgi:hypothetical protein